MTITHAEMREMITDDLRAALDEHRARLETVRAAIPLHEAALKELGEEMTQLTGGAWSRGTGIIDYIKQAIKARDAADALAVEWDAACGPVWEVEPPEYVRVRKITAKTVYLFDEKGRDYRFLRKNGKSANSFSTATICVAETIAKHERHVGGAA